MPYYFVEFPHPPIFTEAEYYNDNARRAHVYEMADALRKDNPGHIRRLHVGEQPLFRVQQERGIYTQTSVIINRSRQFSLKIDTDLDGYPQQTRRIWCIDPQAHNNYFARGNIILIDHKMNDGEKVPLFVDTHEQNLIVPGILIYEDGKIAKIFKKAHVFARRLLGKET